MIFGLLFNSETTSGTVVVLDSCMCLEFKTNIYVLKEIKV
jgi:hypothetical protein